MSVAVQSPLVGFESGSQPVDGMCGVHFEELAGDHFFNLRIDPEEASLLDQVNDALGLSLPLQANTCCRSEALMLYWMGPDEWLIRMVDKDALDRIAKLKSVLEGHFASLVDNSSGLTVLRVSGDGADYVLRQGMVFDIHAREFSEGQCTQTVLAKTGITLSVAGTNENRVFELVIRRSFADYAMHFLRDAAVTIGYQLKV